MLGYDMAVTHCAVSLPESIVTLILHDQLRTITMYANDCCSPHCDLPRRVSAQLGEEPGVLNPDGDVNMQC